MSLIMYHINMAQKMYSSSRWLTDENVPLSVLSHHERALSNKTSGNSSSPLLKLVPGPALAVGQPESVDHRIHRAGFDPAFFFPIIPRLMQLLGEA